LLIRLEGGDREARDTRDRERFHQLLLHDGPTLIVLVRSGAHGQVVQVHNASASQLPSTVRLTRRRRDKRRVGDPQASTTRTGEEKARNATHHKGNYNVHITCKSTIVVPLPRL
jgi:hypothetical protein